VDILISPYNVFGWFSDSLILIGSGWAQWLPNQPLWR